MNVQRLCSSLEVVLYYRQEIDKLTEICIKNLYSEVEKKKNMFSDQTYTKDLEKLLYNLSLQLKQFEKVVCSLKARLSSVCALKIEDAIKCAEKIKNELLYECKLFEHFFQAYAFRDDLLNSLRDNQVTIIVADGSCCFNKVLPPLIQTMFPQRVIVSCENCEILKRGLSYWLSNFFEENIDKNLFSDKGSANDKSCLSEKQLLSYFVDNKFIFKQPIVILNVPLIRSIESDILLLYLRDMVTMNKNSKLILIISPYTDLSGYQNYFSKTVSDGVQILKIPCISFPVSTVWKKDSLTPLEDYVSHVVHTIMSILALHDFGDILAFLPDFNDLKVARDLLRKQLKNFCYNNVEYFSIHENALDYDLSPNSKRAVFLSTDCAEATVFPSVKFVVDCGIQKSRFYDNLLKKDILKSTFISCRKARMRKSLAGKFSNGICYRIYNKQNYFMDMTQKDCPEILRVNPYNTVIKIIQYRSGKTLQFVEFFPRQILQNVIKDLQKYEAVKGNSLTPMGKDMGKLPFDLKYSKLILLALKKGFAFESVVLIAFFCNKQGIFYQTENEMQQKFIDAIKLQLAVNESDTFLYLSIYKSWIESNSSSEWCKNHFINPNTMRKIHTCVLEICDIVNKSLGKKIILEFSDFQNYDLELIEILFECFQFNLCVYTGHSKSGYRILSSSELAFIHSESVTYQTESEPQFIFYDDVISNKTITLFHITVVPSDIVMKALMNGKLPYTNEDLFDTALTCRTIEPVGEELLNDLLLGPDGKKLRKIEENIKKECGCDLVFLDASLNKGCIYVYTLPDYINFAQCFIQDILKSKFDSLLSENQMEILDLNYNQNTISFEINWSKGAVATNLYQKSQSEILNTFHQDNIDSENFDISDTHYFPYQLLIAWIRRPCSGKGYVNFNSAEYFMIARKLALRNIKIFGCDTFIQTSNKKENQLYITGLPPETNAENLKQELQLLIPNSIIDSVELEYKPPFTMENNDLISLRTVIADVCKEFTILGEFDLTLLKPNPKDLDMVVNINVANNEFLSLIAEVLSGIVVKNKKFVTKILYNLVVKCNKELCKVLKPAFISELERIKKDVRNFTENNNDFKIGFSIDLESEEKALIKISSDNNELLSLLHRKVNDLLAGEMLSSQTVKDLENIFFYGGQVWLKNLEKAENVHIVTDNKLKTLTLYGSQVACDNVKCQIAMFLEDAENHVIQTISLSTEQNSSSMLLKAVIKKFGVNLEHFIESCDLHSALLDIKAHQLLVRGSTKSIEQAEECIKTLSDELDIIIPDVEQSHEICPVCVCPAYNLTFRLEHCGHLYCLECIQALVEQAQFPVHCCAENCAKDIIVKDIRKILKEDPAKIKTLLEKSMKDYLERNRINIFYCPAPDCSMFFYKKELPDNKLNCPLCRNDICPKCNIIYHGGYTCDMYQNSKKDPDYSFKVWQKTTVQCKQCPRCKTAIEKVSGCNRMKCRSCNGSFCWICVKEFRTDQEVYNHIHSAHRGMLFV